MVLWGDDWGGRLRVPAGLGPVSAIAAGSWHNLALLQDGTVVGWGDNKSGQLDVPAGLEGVTAIAAGGSHSLALGANGSVAAWGSNIAGEIDVPPGLGEVTAIAAGSTHSLALKADGTVVAWGGSGMFGAVDVPPGLRGVTAIAAGEPNLALLRDGTVVAWGGIPGVSVPQHLSGVTAIATGHHCLALRSDGTVTGWGPYREGVVDVPRGLTGVTAIAAGMMHGVALTRAGRIVAWGKNEAGQTNVPAELGEIAIDNSIQDADDARFRNHVVNRLRGTRYDPWGDSNLRLLVPSEVLIDLLMISLSPSEADRTLDLLRRDASHGDTKARAQMRLVDNWVRGQDTGNMRSIAETVPARDLPDLIDAASELVSLLLLTAFATSPRRISAVHDAISSESEKLNPLAVACDALMEVSFQKVKASVPAYEAALQSSPARTHTPPPKQSGGCYVATAVYGSYDCPEVWVLRRYRDRVLSTSRFGRAFIRAYYLVSPGALKVAGPAIRHLTKGPLDMLVKTLKMRGFSDSTYVDESDKST